MPEIAEVTLTAQALKDMLLNKQLTTIKIISGRYSNKPFEGYHKMILQLPLKVTNIDTKGKFLWFDFKNNDKTSYLMNTFGLSGRWSFSKVDNAQIEFNFQDGIIAYYIDSRNFGTFEYDDSGKSLNSKLNKLAPDLLKTNFTKEEFKGWIQDFLNKSSQRKDMIIVKVLMDQTKLTGLGSGLGNYLVPEILYRAQLSPHRTMGSLTSENIYTLADTIKLVLKQCYVYNVTGYMENMTEFVDKHYQGMISGKYPDYHPEIKISKGSKFVFQVYRQKNDPLGNKVVGEKIMNDRTTYWVPSVQK